MTPSPHLKIIPVGAAGGEGTGACYNVQTKNARILEDCGLFQGGKKSEALNRPPIAPKCKVDAVLLAHGEDEQRAALAKLIQQKFRLPSQSPAMGEVIEL